MVNATRKPWIKTTGTKWFWVKKETGPTLRYKARRIALGFLQHYVVDCFKAYAAMVSINSIRILLSTCCAIGYNIKKSDVDNAFLNAAIQEEVYLEAPKGLTLARNMFWSKSENSNFATISKQKRPGFSIIPLG